MALVLLAFYTVNGHQWRKTTRDSHLNLYKTCKVTKQLNETHVFEHVQDFRSDFPI